VLVVGVNFKKEETLRKAILASSLPTEVKELKLQEIDKMFEIVADYYSKKG